MTVNEIFEKVNLVMPLEQRRFFNYLEDTITELSAVCSNFVYEKGKEETIPKKLEDEFFVLPLYTGAICDNIIFLAGGDETYKSEFLRKAHETYLKYWNDNAKGRRIKRMEW